MCDRDCATKEGWSAIGAAQLRSANVPTERPTLFEQQKAAVQTAALVLVS
jgi:hypothetical protein